MVTLLTKGVDGALSAVAVSKVSANKDDTGRKAFGENHAREVFVAECRKLLIERKDNYSRDSGGGQKFNLLTIAEDGVRFATGFESRVRVTIKRDDGGLCFAGHGEKLADDLPVSTMNSVKFPDTDRATLPIARE